MICFMLQLQCTKIFQRQLCNKLTRLLETGFEIGEIVKVAGISGVLMEVCSNVS